jgi:hypothetical protein
MAGDVRRVAQELSLDAYATRLGTVGGADLVAELERLVGHPLDRVAIQARRLQRKMELVRQLKPRPGVLTYLQQARALGLAVAVVSTDDVGVDPDRPSYPRAPRRLGFHRVRQWRPSTSQAVARLVRVRSLRRANPVRRVFDRDGLRARQAEPIERGEVTDAPASQSNGVDRTCRGSEPCPGTSILESYQHAEAPLRAVPACSSCVPRLELGR